MNKLSIYLSKRFDLFFLTCIMIVALFMAAGCKNEKDQNDKSSLPTPGENWVEEPPSNNMRLKQYYLSQNPDIKMNVFKFPSGNSSVQENFQRWREQFTSIKNEETIKINDKRNAIIINGTFKKKPFPMAQDYTEIDHTVMLAAIISLPDGDYFFKATGKENELGSEQKEFIQMISSE